MSEVELRAKLLHWGNSYGIRISKQDVERLGLRPDEELRVRVDVDGRAIRVSDLPSFDLGGVADEHDDIFARSVE